jgi:hypothetical protein
MDRFAGFYSQPYPGTDPPQDLNGYTQDASMSGMDPSAMVTTGMGQAQTLHQIISQNSEELMRRRNNPPSQYRQGAHDHGRRSSMLEFSSALDGDLADFQFDPNPNEANISMGSSNMVPMQKSLDPRRVRSREDLNLNTQFSRMNTNFENMQSMNSFSPAIIPSTSVTVDPSTAYIPQDLEMEMALDFDAMDASANVSAMQEPMYTASPIDQTFQMPYQATGHNAMTGGSMSPQIHSRMAAMAQGMSPMSESYPRPSQQLHRPTPLSTSVSVGRGPSSAMASPAHLQQTPHRRLSIDSQTPYSSKGSEYSRRRSDRYISG